jgi:hypothetical protein
MAGAHNGTSSTSGYGGAAAHLWDNVLYILTGAIGALVLLYLHWTLVVAQIAASILGPLWMMVKVCPNCLLYGKDSCKSGYGIVSSKLTGKGDPKSFGEAFKHQLAAVIPMWIIPLTGFIYMVIVGIDAPWLLFIAFVLVAYVGVTLKARYITCPRCANRANCPWGSKASINKRVR